MPPVKTFKKRLVFIAFKTYLYFLPKYFIIAGFFIGTIVSFLTSGYLCVYGFDNGWPSIFYIHGRYVTFLNNCKKILRQSE